MSFESATNLILINAIHVPCFGWVLGLQGRDDALSGSVAMTKIAERHHIHRHNNESFGIVWIQNLYALEDGPIVLGSGVIRGSDRRGVSEFPKISNFPFRPANPWRSKIFTKTPSHPNIGFKLNSNPVPGMHSNRYRGFERARARAFLDSDAHFAKAEDISTEPHLFRGDGWHPMTCLFVVCLAEGNRR
jgi:hypothetical protein